MESQNPNFGFRPDFSFRGLLEDIRQDEESPYKSKGVGEKKDKKKKDEPKSGVQNVLTDEEPKADAEEMGLEDHDKDDFNQPGKTVQSKTPKNPKLAIKEVPEDKKQVLKDSTNESKEELYLCGNCHTTFRSNEASCTGCYSNIVEKVVNEEDEEESFERWIDINSRELRYDYSRYVEQCRADDKYAKRFREWARDEFKSGDETDEMNEQGDEIAALRDEKLAIEQEMLEKEKAYRQEQNEMGARVDELNQRIKELEGQEKPEEA